ncbi:MAG: hypothetical protein II411_05980, partial [Lachnospiraceae bacterium]|nr:hypothetical protein [Lachnospiraceae bacterium]
SGKDSFTLGLFGADDHKHWVCGRTNCTDIQKVHFNENMNTSHPVSGDLTYQAVNSYDEFKSAIESGRQEKDYLYLTNSFTINEVVKLKRPLFICLNGKTINFTAAGQLCTYYDQANPTIDTLGTYPYDLAFCGCTADANGFSGTLDGQNAKRTYPAIYYTKSKGVYFFGLGNRGLVNASNEYTENETRIKIKNFLLSTASSTKYRPMNPKSKTGSSDKFAYPGNGSYTVAEQKDFNSAFLTMSINDTEQANTQTTRQAFFYAIDVENVYSNDGGFANLYYVNSLAVEHSKFKNVGAFRGGIMSVDFNNRRYLQTTGTSVINDYINIGHSLIDSCGLGSKVAGGLVDNETWGTARRYKNGITIGNGKGAATFSPDKNGLFLLENYDGGSTLERYRLIKGNKFTNNIVGSDTTTAQGYMIYLVLDSVGNSTTNITNNTFDGNYGGAIYIENIYNEKNGRPATTKNEGTFYVDNNIIKNNKMDNSGIATDSKPKRLGILNFYKVGTALINSKVTVTSQQSIEGSYGIGCGAVQCEYVDTLYVYNTKFKNNYSNAENGKGGSILISTCSSAFIGNPNKQEISKVEFINEDATNHNIAYGGAIYAFDVTTLNISDSTFTGNVAARNGGAVFVSAENRNSALNVYGTSFTNNEANATNEDGYGFGGAIYYKGDSKKKYSHKFNSLYYIYKTNANSFTGNKTVKLGQSIYLEDMTEECYIRNTNITNSNSDTNASYDKSEVAYLNGKKNLNLGTVDFSGNKVTSNTKKYSVLYVKSSNVIFETAVKIHDNTNPVRLSNATMSMASYDYRNHAADGVVTGIPVDEDILFYENVGDYVIGVDNDTANNIYLKQGMVYNNTGLFGVNRSDNSLTVGEITYDGAF